MKIIVASDGDDENSNVSEHFGRCKYYIIWDNGKITSIENPYVAHSPGQMPEFIKSLGADIIISGGMGKRAVENFKKLGIKVFTGARGKVIDAIKNYSELGNEPCEKSKNDLK